MRIIEIIKRNYKILAAGIIIITVAAIWVLNKYANTLLNMDNLKSVVQSIRSMGALGIILYLLGYGIGTMLFLPGLPFTLLGGMTYGVFWGTLYAVIGDMVGVVGAFLLARYVAKKRIKKYIYDNKSFHKINKGVEEEGWRILLATRFSGIIPQSMQNYLYGITSISFLMYAVITCISILPGTAIWVFVINTVGKGQEDAKRAMLYISVSVILLVVVSYLPKWYYKRKCTK